MFKPLLPCPHSRVGVCSVIPTTMGEAAGAWLRESCTREGCVPETRTSKFLSRPEGSPGRFVQLSGRMSRRICLDSQELSEVPTNRSTFLAREHLLRSEKLLVVYMESCFRSLATQSLLPGQHRLQPGQRIHYCVCELCVRADFYLQVHETKLQDSLRRVDTPRRTDQG